jgi:hypothetical protein
MNGFMCGPAIYRYDGWTFEVHGYCGPAPLTVHDEPWKRIPRRFWVMWEKFRALPVAEQAACRVVRGGCQRIA